jgi:hypothetical protein
VSIALCGLHEFRLWFPGLWPRYSVLDCSPGRKISVCQIILHIPPGIPEYGVSGKIVVLCNVSFRVLYRLRDSKSSGMLLKQTCLCEMWGSHGYEYQNYGIPRCYIDGYQHFGGTCSLHFQPLLLYPGEQSSRLLRNVCRHTHMYNYFSFLINS